MTLVVVAVAGVNLVNYNTGRQTMSLGNEGLTMLFVSNTVLVGLGQANAMYRLAPGDNMDLSVVVDGQEIKQPWSAISDAAGGLLRWAETSERR